MSLKNKVLIGGILTAAVFSNGLYAYGTKQVLNKKITYINSMDKNDRLTVRQFLESLLTNTYGINLDAKDQKAEKYLSQKMPYVNLRNKSIRFILDYLLGSKNYFYKLDNGILSIAYFKTKMYNLDFIYNVRKGSTNLDSTDNKVNSDYTFDFFDKIKSNVETLLRNNAGSKEDFKEPILDKEAGVLTVTGTKKQLKAVNDYITKLMKRLSKEVLIDVKMYSVELSESHQTGINWSQLDISLNAQNTPLRGTYLLGSQSVFNNAVFNLNGLLNFLAQNGNVNSISNPKIMTLNNQKAIVSVGDTIYYKYVTKVAYDPNGNPLSEYAIDSKFVGVVLDITPQIDDNNNIILSINPRISAFKDVTQLTNTDRGMPPDTSDKNIFTVVKLKDGQTLVLGGLITNDKTLKVNGVPVLKEIPVIKYLFSSKEEVSDKKEFVFVITPHIIDLSKKQKLEQVFGSKKDNSYELKFKLPKKYK